MKRGEEQKNSQKLPCKLCKKICFIFSCPSEKEMRKEQLASDITDELIKETFSKMELHEEEKSILSCKDSQYENLIHLRSKTIDWLVIVCAELKQGDSTFFLTVQIIDKMLEYYKFDLSAENFHLISIVSLFIASKYEEITPISLSTLTKEVGHQKYSKNDILSAELVILAKLNFKIPKIIFMDFINILLNATFSQSSTGKYITNGHVCKYQQMVFNHACSIYKFILLDYMYNKKTNIFLNYSNILYQSLLEINDKMDYKSYCVENFPKMVENFLVTPSDFYENLEKFKKMKELFENNKNRFQFLSTIGFGKFVLKK